MIQDTIDKIKIIIIMKYI